MRIARRLPPALASAAASLIVGSCAPRNPPRLADLCGGANAEARVVAVVDQVRGPGGPALAGLEGTRFELRFEFSPPTAVADANATAGKDCDGATGSASFTRDIPAAIRAATSSASVASWRIQGDTVLLDLNPRVRDSNVFFSLPLDGGRGHWGLSTFAGEVAGGHTEPAP